VQYPLPGLISTTIAFIATHLQLRSPLNSMFSTNISHSPTRPLIPSRNKIQHYIRLILPPHDTSIGFPALRRLVVYAVGRNTAKSNVFGFLRICTQCIPHALRRGLLEEFSGVEACGGEQLC
jgi:hypothetical protein